MTELFTPTWSSPGLGLAGLEMFRAVPDFSVEELVDKLMSAFLFQSQGNGCEFPTAALGSSVLHVLSVTLP